MEYYDYMMTENQQQEMNEAQANFDNYMIGCIVGFLNMNNIGEFVHNPTEETVYDNVEGYYLTYDEVRMLGDDHNFNLQNYVLYVRSKHNG